MNIGEPLQVSYRKLAENKGAKRIWLQGLCLKRAGYEIGKNYTVDEDKDSREISIKLTDSGNRIVSRKKNGDKEYPVIDINNGILEEFFGKDTSRVRVVIAVGVIKISIHPDDKARLERMERMVNKIMGGESIDIGSICHGIGVLDHAVHVGLADEGIDSRLAWAIDMEQAYLQASLDNNSVWDEKSLLVHSMLHEVEPTNLSKVELLLAGLPCTGASKSGISKNKLKYAEQHETAGNAFVAFLMIVKTLQPTILLIENVTEYANTVSMHVIRDCLELWGYELHETIVERDLGAFEDRKRLCVVGVTKGVPFDLKLLPVAEVESSLGEILEDVPLDSPMWKKYSYLDAKQLSDKSKGNGFKMQLLDETATKVGTIGRGYQKVRSTEPLIKHPTKPGLRRLLTVNEVAAVKKIPLELVRGLSQKTAFEGMGQSVLYPCFQSVGRNIAKAIWCYVQQSVKHDVPLMEVA